LHFLFERAVVAKVALKTVSYRIDLPNTSWRHTHAGI